MFLFKKKLIVLIALLLIMVLSVIITFAYVSRLVYVTKETSYRMVKTWNIPQRFIKNLTVWHIGGSNTMLDAVLGEMQQLGVKEIKPLEIQDFFSNDTSKSIGFNKSVVVIFDGDWISKRIDDLEIHRFLKEASYKGAKLIAIGGLTSKLFEALDKAGVNELGRDEAGNVRNPAYFNPPAVGFKLKEASMPNGYPYFYSSIFACNTQNVDAIVQELINW